MHNSISQEARGCQARELKQAWGTWLSGLADWNWFATLTFRDPPADRPGWTRVGWKYSGKAWNTFINQVGLAKGLHDVSWVRCREYQYWRGVPHFHALVAGVSELRRDEAWQFWFENYGIARILPYDPQLGAGFYLCKYVTKELGDIRFSENLKGG